MGTRVRCPECETWLNLKLIPARVVSRSHYPDMYGPASFQSYHEITPRTVTWDCPNPKCDQREGHPQVKHNSDFELSPEDKLEIQRAFTLPKITQTQERLMKSIRETGLRLDQGNWTFGEKRSVASLIKRGWVKNTCDRLTLTPVGKRVLNRFESVQELKKAGWYLKIGEGN